jgi:hypothetical protein
MTYVGGNPPVDYPPGKKDLLIILKLLINLPLSQIDGSTCNGGQGGNSTYIFFIFKVELFLCEESSQDFLRGFPPVLKLSDFSYELSYESVLISP